MVFFQSCCFSVMYLFLIGLVGVLSSVVPSESFGIGTMLIQYLYCEFGLSVLVRCRGVSEGR